MKKLKIISVAQSILSIVLFVVFFILQMNYRLSDDVLIFTIGFVTVNAVSALVPNVIYSYNLLSSKIAFGKSDFFALLFVTITALAFLRLAKLLFTPIGWVMPIM